MVETNDEWIQSRVGIRERRIAARTRPSTRWPGGPPTGARERRPGAGGRLRRRRHLHRDRPLPEHRRPGRRPARPRQPGRDRREHRLLRVHPRAGHRRPRDPGRRRDQGAGHRRREAERLDRLDRPHHLRADRRRRRRRGRGRRPTSPSVGPVVWGSVPEMSRRGPDRGPRRPVRAGGPERLPLGHHATAGHRPAGLREGRPRSPRTSAASSCTRPTCASSSRSPSGSARSTR